MKTSKACYDKIGKSVPEYKEILLDPGINKREQLSGRKIGEKLACRRFPELLLVCQFVYPDNIKCYTKLDHL